MCNDDLPNCRIRPRDYYRIELLSFLNVRYIVSPYPLDDPSLELIESRDRELLLAREELRTGEKWRLNLKGEYGTGTALFIYRNRDVLPRYFLVDRVLSYATDHEMFAALSAASVPELHQTAYVGTSTAERLPALSLGGQQIPVEQLHATSDRVTLRTTASGTALLTTSMGYSRFWKACVDKAPSEVLRVNHAFIGVVAPAGTHEIELFYDPPYRLGHDPC